MTGKIIVPALALVFLTAASCSLKYSDTLDVDDSVPELYFTKAKITRYENDRVTVEMAADKLEQYKDSSESYARKLTFTVYDDENQVSTEGSCGYLFADTSKDLYELYEGIELYNHSDKTNFFADILRWNKKNEQLTSGLNSEVRVEKEDTVMTGTGFSASGISKTFTFSGGVKGEIETSEAEE
ncbi:LPS export ABC transporter periplasmic protein LptC [Treponema sp. C6A8]|uniref:LPS export ABC transporter periplasmic protein LptC n=1 Tax=Treponema sp. C6A8 TaxID=1410609 RepID=UPI000482C6D5|nr:LPS export ABC transporter periplasmic protein LptC [Treponema sp. C6A8]